MTEPIEQEYFDWLCAKVMSAIPIRTPSLTHMQLLWELYSTEFVWLVSGDDNRAEDGLDLRKEFLTNSHLSPDREWQMLGCSVFEMLIAFARRAEFETDCSAEIWFWSFLENLDLYQYNDSEELPIEEVQEILENFIWRSYSSNGLGGMFPLNNPEHDQRKVEVWYQFCEYLVDNEQETAIGG